RRGDAARRRDAGHAGAWTRPRRGRRRPVPDVPRRTRGPWRSGRASAPRRGRGGGAARPRLKRTREPALAALAAAKAGDLSTRAGDLLRRLEWPGKPGVAAVTPLTAEEQARFDAGKVVYQNLCQA